MAAIANHHVADIADALAVDENFAHLDRLGLVRAVRGQLQNVAVLEQKAIGRRHAHVLSQPSVSHQVAILAVDRHEVARPGELEHRLQLFLARMAGNVNLRDLLVVHLRATPVKMIDQIGNRLLVAGNELRRKDYGVAGRYFDSLVIIQSDPVQHGQRLALAAGGKKCELIVRQVVPPLAFSHEITRQMKIAQLRRDLAIANHAPPTQYHAPATALGNIDHLLDARDARGKSRDQHFAGALLHDLLEIGPDLALGRRVARALDVGRVGHQEQHAFFTVGGEGLKVEHLAFHRRVVDLEIAGVNDRSDRRFDGEGQAIHQAVGDANAFDAKRRYLPRNPGGDLTHVRAILQIVFGQFVGQETESETGAEDRHVEVLQDIRQRANMVFVGVGEDDRFELVAALEQIAYVGNH